MGELLPAFTFLGLQAIEQSIEIIWGKFPIGIPFHGRRQKWCLVLVHLWRLPWIKVDQNYLPVVVP